MSKTENRIIAGALFDFLGYLTTRDKPTSFGSTEWAAPAVDLLTEWAKTRSLSLDDPAIADWHKAQQPAADIDEAQIARLHARGAVAWAGVDAADLRAGGDGLPAASGEPVAYMWQHDETGRTGFVDAWQLQNGWRENNPRLHVVAPLYAAPQPAPAPAALANRLTLECDSSPGGPYSVTMTFASLQDAQAAHRWVATGAQPAPARVVNQSLTTAAAPTAQQETKP